MYWAKIKENKHTRKETRLGIGSQVKMDQTLDYKRERTSPNN